MSTRANSLGRRMLAEPWTWVGALVVLAAAARLLVSVLRFRDAQMDGDEAFHACEGQYFAHAFRALSPREIEGLLLRPSWHPPAHGFALGAWFTTFGSSVPAARLYTVAWYAVLGLVVTVSASTLRANGARHVAFLPALLFFNDPEHAALGGLAMLEVPAEACALFALLCFFRETGRARPPSLWKHAGSTSAALLTFFYRYQHGIVVLAALAAAHGVLAFRALRARDARSALPAAGFMAAATGSIALWLFGFGQLRGLLIYSHAQPQTVARWSLANLVYYPRALLEGSPLDSLVVFACVACLALALRRRELTLREGVYLAYLVVAFVVLFFVRQKDVRFGLILHAPLWLLTASLAAALLPHPERRGASPTSLALAFAATAAAQIAYRSPFPAAFENAGNGLTRMYEAVAAVVEPWRRSKTTIVLLGRDDIRSSAALAFNLVAACDARRVSCAVTVDDEADLRLGRLRGSSPRRGYAARLGEALRRADFVVSYREPPPELAARPRRLNQPASFRISPRGKSRRFRVIVLGTPSA